jgi:ribonuclease P protein component
LISGVVRRASLERLRRGVVVRAGPLSVRYAPGEGPAAEVAYAIRRRAGSAVARNRCRRRLRAWVHQADRAGSLPPGVYLIGVRDEAVGATYRELESWMRQAIEALARKNETAP